MHYKTKTFKCSKCGQIEKHLPKEVAHRCQWNGKIILFDLVEADELTDS